MTEHDDLIVIGRGDYLPREEANGTAQAVFVDGKYQAAETWTNADGGTFSPQLHSYVGGNSKVRGSALFRPRERDGDEITHAGGISPAWPLKYDAFAPDEDGFATPTSTCIRRTVFDGFPCLLTGKADAQAVCIDPMLAKHENVTLMTNAYVSKLGTDASEREIEAVHVERTGKQEIYSADMVVVACGSLSSALLLLRSANDRHSNGLANGSDQVGRNYMRHEMSVVMAVMHHVNETVFQTTLAFNEIARHSIDFWLQADDLPHPDNGVYHKDGKVHLDLVQTNPEALKLLKRKLKDVLSEIGWAAVLLERSLYLGKSIRLSGTAHQAGTCRFGTDPATSVLNLDCHAHEVDNLDVADASFFPSIGAVNPTLTIIANALSVADIIGDRQ